MDSPSSRPIRLTYLITDLKVGGVPLHLYRLATRLPRDRVHVRVVTLAGEGPVATMLRRSGVPVQTCNARGPWDLAALHRLWRQLRRDPPDILHALLFHANMAARVVGPAAGLPLRRIVCEIQTVERERPWHLVVDNLTCRLCRCEIGNSPSVIQHLHQQAHIPPARLRCEWGAVDVDAVAGAEPAAREEFGVSPDELLVLWTGRLDPVKGFEEMLPAFAQTCRNRAARLLLAGEGAYRPAVEELIRVGGLAGRALLLGERADVPRLLKSADVFLFCSRTEGLPNALLEAMAAALPIVATDVPGCRDLIENGETGLLAGPAAGDIARQLAWLLDHPAEAKRMGLRAQQWVRERADSAGLASRWMRFYEDVLGSRSEVTWSEDIPTNAGSTS